MWRISGKIIVQDDWSLVIKLFNKLQQIERFENYKNKVNDTLEVCVIRLRPHFIQYIARCLRAIRMHEHASTCKSWQKRSSVCLKALVYWVCHATAKLAKIPPLREMNATWSVFRELLLLTTLLHTGLAPPSMHTHKGRAPHGWALHSPCQGQVGDTCWHRVTRKGGNHTPECPDIPVTLGVCCSCIPSVT